VVQYPVTYACVPDSSNPALGSITRYWGYAIQASQPTTFVGASSALTAKNVSACAMSYAPNAVMLRTGVVSVAVQLTSSLESLYLFQQVHVSNVP
jgi:MSHA biogenesis protein MshO